MKGQFQNIVKRETMLYLFFGVLTTAVNFGTFVVVNWLVGDKYYLFSNICSFIAATIFAFVTNKQFVFESKDWGVQIVIKELISFVSARISTFLIVEEAGLLLAVEVLKVNELEVLSLNGTILVKMFLAFFAVLVNYVLSKYFIFGQRRNMNESDFNNSRI